MTVNEAIEAYEKKFGGYPAFLLMGADDETIIKELTRCVKTGKELEAPTDGDY